jgi:hypothetical protein
VVSRSGCTNRRKAHTELHSQVHSTVSEWEGEQADTRTTGQVDNQTCGQVDDHVSVEWFNK